MYFVSVLWDEKNNNKSKSMISYTIKSNWIDDTNGFARCRFSISMTTQSHKHKKNVLEFHTLTKTFHYFLFKRKNNTCVGNSLYQCALLSSTALLRLNIGKHIQTRAHIALAQSQSVSQPDRHKHTLSLIRTVYYAINIYSTLFVYFSLHTARNKCNNQRLSHTCSFHALDKR